VTRVDLVPSGYLGWDQIDPRLVAAAEVERLTALGASIIEPAHDDGGFLTAILVDPQGNEFCVIKPPVGGYDERRVIAEGEARQAGRPAP
jgi:Glyoxalase-like domain